MAGETGQARPELAAEVTQRLTEATPGAPPDALARGQVLADRYVVEGRVGSGGRGTVYRAYDRGTGAWVAIKLLNPGAAAGEEELFRELCVARAIQHPNVCRIFEVIRDGERTFLTMEFAARGTLADTLKQGPDETPPDRLRDVGGVIGGLAAIHAAGLLHRDLKPENVLRMQDGRLVLSDFGLARRIDQTQMTAEHAGTPGYIAPELLSGTGKPAVASDLWSLGVVLRAIVAGDPKLERATRTLVRLCLDADPARRPTDASALLRRWTRARRGPGRSWTWRLAVATLAVALIGLAGAAWKKQRSGRSGNAFPPLLGAGTAPDWRNSRLLLDVSGSRWGCLTSLPPEHRRLRVLLTSPSKVLEIDPHTGQIAPAKLSTKVFPDGRLISCPQTAPDGRGLLWARKGASNQREIWYSPSPDGEGGRLITRGTGPLWLPSGRDFVFNTDSGRLARGNLEGRTLLFDNEPVQSPDWMITAVDPGGKTVALFGSPFEGSNSGYVDIYDIARLTRTARHEIARRTYNGTPAFHPLTGRLQFPTATAAGDRRPIGYWAELDEAGQFQVRGRLEGRGIRKAVWTTAGMVFQSADRRRLLLQGPAGERTELPAHVPGPYFDVAATGDAVYSHNTSPTTNVIRLRRPDGRIVTLAEGHHDFAPDISRDGRWIVFIRDMRHVVLCQRPEGTAPRCETIVKDVSPGERPGVRVSPDGRRVAFLSREETTGSLFLRVFSRDDGQLRDLGEVEYSCALHWGTGRTVWYVSPSPVEWVGVDAETGQVLERSGKPGMRLEDICVAPPPGAPANPYQIVDERPEAIRLFVPPR